ncbi:Abi family protein [Moraxella marmotae]|uniref:Abi family protein n=1 Tax=Moraxella marmotae TaxID=3344520 RepID=UPI0035F3EC4F
MPSKPKAWIDTPDQLDLLKKRGLVIDDDGRALHYLQSLGYYRLSGYIYPFRQVQNGQKVSKLIDDTNFNTILQLYLFDKGLRILAFDALERIEMAIRTDIAHTLGKHHPDAHEMPEYLDKKFTTKAPNQTKSKHDIWREKYQKLLQSNAKQDFIKHHLDNYQYLPIWAAREILDFGALSHLYGGLKYKDRQKIAQKYHTTANMLGKWLKSLNFIRNIVAHHGRLWNLNIVERSDFEKSFAHIGNRLENHKAFGYFYLMGYFLDIISPNSTWKCRVIAHIHDNFPKVSNNAISLADFGYRDDIGTLWQAKQNI